MKHISIFALTVLALATTACELPDVVGMNSMPKTTQGMSDKMTVTNEAIRKQKLLLAVQQLNDPKNQKDIFPVPTGLIPAGTLFAETATPEELIKYTYNELKKIEENDAVIGIEEDGSPTPLDAKEKAISRKEKYATLYSVMIIAAFAPDSAIEEIVRHDINGNSRFQKTALEFLALRAAFLRDILLAKSLGIESSSPDLLDNSGKMEEALKYLLKLDQVSKMDLNYVIQVKINNKMGLLSFEEVQDQAGRKATAAMWKLAVEKAKAGNKAYALSVKKYTEGVPAEQQKQMNAIDAMQSYAQSWETYLK